MSDWKDDAYYTPHQCWVAVNPNGVPVVVPTPEEGADTDDSSEA